MHLQLLVGAGTGLLKHGRLLSTINKIIKKYVSRRMFYNKHQVIGNQFGFQPANVYRN